MSHLIQPIDIEGTKHCVKHGATTPKWRSLSILEPAFELNLNEDDDHWKTSADGITSSANSRITYATCCIWKATVRISTVEAIYEGRVEINGNIIQNFTVFDQSTTDVVVDLNALGLMGRACGNIWDIYVADFDGFNLFRIDVEIIDVTFGPPV